MTGASPPSLASVLTAPTAAHTHPWSLSICAYLYLLVSGLLITHVIQHEKNVFTLQTLVAFEGSIPKETCNVKVALHREPLQPQGSTKAPSVPQMGVSATLAQVEPTWWSWEPASQSSDFEELQRLGKWAGEGLSCVSDTGD